MFPNEIAKDTFQTPQSHSLHLARKNCVKETIFFVQRAVSYCVVEIGRFLRRTIARDARDSPFRIGDLPVMLFSYGSCLA